jgi:hypothetical protein
VKRPNFKSERTCLARGALRLTPVPGVSFALMFFTKVFDGLDTESMCEGDEATRVSFKEKEDERRRNS